MVWCMLSLVLFSILPSVNWIFSGASIPLTDTHRLFNLDLAHGYINRFLYRQGISGNFKRVVVGQKGWMFLGNHYDKVMDKARGRAIAETSPANISKSILELKKRQEWLAARGIKTVFAIAPNKHTIYHEYLPAKNQHAVRNPTDAFLARARAVKLNVVDLRSELLEAKAKSAPRWLYYKTDSHWNRYGAFLGYRYLLSGIDRIYGTKLKSVKLTDRHWTTRGGGDLSRLLKFDTLLDGNVDMDFEISYKGSDALLCIQNLDIQSVALVEDCKKSKNHSAEVNSHSRASFNQHALNNLKVLWLRDSYGNNNSMLLQQTFSTVWEMHYNNFVKVDWHSVIDKLHPDIVIYQVVERAIFGRAFQQQKNARGG